MVIIRRQQCSLKIIQLFINSWIFMDLKITLTKEHYFFLEDI